MNKDDELKNLLAEKDRVRVIEALKAHGAISVAPERAVAPRREGVAANPFAHAEAFCLMAYATKDNARIERVWNSRDGVTPFIIGSADKGLEMQHVRWERDVFAPNHVPRLGDRVFIDMTLERRRARAQLQAEHWWDDAKYPARERYASKEHMVDCLIEDFDPALREPDLLTITDSWHIVAVCASARDEYTRIVGHPPVSTVTRTLRFA